MREKLKLEGPHMPPPQDDWRVIKEAQKSVGALKTVEERRDAYAKNIERLRKTGNTKMAQWLADHAEKILSGKDKPQESFDFDSPPKPES